MAADFRRLSRRPGDGPGRGSVREKLFEIIFEADTAAGRAFDIALIWVIVLSVFAAMLESVAAINARAGDVLRTIEWVITGLFTIEYALRLYCVERPLRYARSFFGLVDLLAIVPTYLSLLLPGSQSLSVVRAIRLLRVMRVFRLVAILNEARELLAALSGARRKIVVFLGAVLIIDIVLGSIMYLIEGPENGFTSIPRSVYWAIITMTTVGYGNVTPQTWLGQAVAAGVMILGYSIIAVPTGIVTAEMTVMARSRQQVTTRTCPHCTSEGHQPSARFCRDCGGALQESNGAA